MAYGYNKYNEPGFASGLTRTNDALNSFFADRGLADVENQQPQQVSPGTPGTPGLADTGQNDATSYGRDVVNDGGTPIDQGVATGPSTGTPGVAPVYKLGGQVFDHAPTPQEVQDAKAQMRASVYRSNGGGEEANKDLAANAELGLKDVQKRKGEQDIATGAITQKQQAIKLKADQRGDVDADLEQEARDEVNSHIRDRQIDPNTISGQSDILAENVAALTKRGLVAQASKVAQEGAQTVLSKTQATSVMRQELSLGVKQALDSGDMGALKDSLSKLNELLPLGGKVVDVQKKDGLIYVSRVDNNGVKTTDAGTTPEVFQQHMDAMTGSKFDSLAQSIIINKLQQAHLTAQINATNASAGASSASAGLSNVKADEARYSFTQQKALDTALQTPEDQRTPNQKALIDGANESAQIQADSKGYRGKADRNDIEGQVKVIDPNVGLAVARMRDPADGVVKTMERDRKNPQWHPVTIATQQKIDTASPGAGGASSPPPAVPMPAGAVVLSADRVAAEKQWNDAPKGAVVKLPDGRVKIKP